MNHIAAKASPGRPPAARTRLDGWRRDHPREWETWGVRRIARACECSHATVRRAKGGATVHDIPPLPERRPAPRGRAIDDVELCELLAHWHGLRRIGAHRTADVVFGGRLHVPLTRIVEAVSKAHGARALLTDDHRAGALVHVVEWLCRRYDPARVPVASRTGAIVARVAWSYLSGCSSRPTHLERLSSASIETTRTVLVPVADHPTSEDARRWAVDHYAVNAARDMGRRGDAWAIRLVTYVRPFADLSECREVWTEAGDLDLDRLCG